MTHRRVVRTTAWTIACAFLAANAGLPTVRAQVQPASVKMAELVIEQGGAGASLRLPTGALVRQTPAEVRNPRLIEIADSPTLIATWEEVEDGERVPFYAVSLDGTAVNVVRATTYELKLRHGEFDPAMQDLPVAAPLRAAEADQTSGLAIVQFVTQPLEVFRQKVEDLGGIVHHYLAHHAYIVEMTPAVQQQIEQLPYVRAITPYHPAYRLEEPLRFALEGLDEPLGTQRYRIEVFHPDGAQKTSLAAAIDGLGGVIHDRDPAGIILEATLTPPQVAEVARRNEVVFIGPWGPPVTTMNNVRIVAGANYLQSVGGYTGTGVRGEIMDAGCLTNHPAYVSRLSVRRPGSADTHGTATFGIVFGDGTGNANGRGLLPTGHGVFSLWAPPNRYTDSAALISAPWNCLFQSNSWGTGPFAQTYTSESSELDRIVFDYDIVILQGQGNYQTQDALREAWGKNIVSVGGIRHFNNSSLGDDAWNGSGSNASIGPASDGRIKPDLSFYYDSILTTSYFENPPGTYNASYTSGFGGTSAATPQTAGCFGLFFEMWADGIFGNPVSGGTVFHERPHASTAKAIMINTARSYSFTGTAHDLTRTHQGWGLPYVQKIYDLRNNIHIVNETDVLQPFQSTSYAVQIIPGQSLHDELKATLVWTDLQGTTSSSQHRINDMTLKVTSPTGTILYGNNGLLAGNWSTPGGSPNTVDTVENVFVQVPEAGIWTVEVTAAEINQDGHVETPQMDMDYALVISGGNTFGDCNQNEIDDRCDVDCAFPGCSPPNCGTSLDCNSNGVPDECELPDCNDNDIPDECDIASGVSEDCNNDGIPDDCQLDGNDCDANLVPDDCDEAALAATIAAPANQHPCPGGQAVFNATAPGATGYQWYLDGTVPLTNGGSVSGADTDTLTISSVGPADEGAYSCMVSFGCITVSSQSAALDLTTDDLQVTLVSPSPIQTCASSGAAIAAFEVSVNDATGVSYQWDRNGDDLVNGGNISGANGKRLEINPANGADVGMYTCTVSNACSAQSPTASGELRISASFAQQPPPTVCAEHGTDAVFTAQAADPQPDIFSWFEGAVQLSDGGRISGANTDTLTLSDVQPGDDGRTFRLRLVVADPFCLNFSEDTELNAQPAGQCSTCPTPGDMDGDGDFDLHDYYLFNLCYGEDVLVRTDCACANVQTENTLVDLDDWTALETLFTGPTP